MNGGADPHPAELHPVVLHHVVNTLGWAALRPLQAAAVGPVAGGRDALLLAPTAGGKTEAAFFPLLSRMEARGWRGLSVLYVTPLRALLNDLQPRLAGYASWLGRRVEVWHGDVGDARRRRVLADPPDVLLTTPESLEAMLVSTRVRPAEVFAHLRAVVVDEIHAFAGDDRGWHLLAVLARLQAVAGRPLQRVGLSATVGNPAGLLAWLQRGGRAAPGAVVDPAAAPGTAGAPAGGTPAGAAPAPADVVVDHVGSVANAATVVAALHRGEKRLVFADSRRRVEELATALRARGVTTFLSHSSLSAQERRRSEQAFAQARDCVVVATSTLELGVDVGDLDRVVQVGAPTTVAGFLQRLGRTGRRPGTRRNTLFLALDDDELLRALGLLRLWRSGWVEPVVPPPSPHHIAAQQVLALVLQEGEVGRSALRGAWQGLPFAGRLDEVVAHLVGAGFLHDEAGLLRVGTAAERAYGRRHFMELTSVFTADPEFTLLHGRAEVGRLHPLTLAVPAVPGRPRVVLLGGRSWAVTSVDWSRRRVWAEPTDDRGSVRFAGARRPLSFAVARAVRDVLLGAGPEAAPDGPGPEVSLTRRAAAALERARAGRAPVVAADRLVVTGDADGPRWWTWAGGAANATLAAALGPAVADPGRPGGDRFLRLLPGVGPDALLAAADAACAGAGGDADAGDDGDADRAGALGGVVPAVSDDALRGLKFSDALPADLARATLAGRLGDPVAAARVLRERRRWSV